MSIGYLAAVLILGSSWQASQDPASTFRAETELVLVPVTVTDRNNRHVSGLKAENLRVRLDRTPVEVAIFEEVRHATKVDALQEPGDPASRENSLSTPGHDGHTILLLDYLNSGTGADGQSNRWFGWRAALSFLADYVAQTDPEPLSFYVLGRDGLLHVTDAHLTRAQLAEAVQELQRTKNEEDSRREGPAEAGLLGLLQRVRHMVADDPGAYGRHLGPAATLDALRQIAVRYAGIPGRKPMLWLTVNMPLPAGEQALERLAREGIHRDGEGAGEEEEDGGISYGLVEQTWRLLSSALISAYPVDMRGLELVGHDIRPGRAGLPTFRTSTRGEDFQQSRALFASIGRLRSAAEATGGRAFYGRNDLATAAREALQESRNYYLVGFYVPREAMRVGWHGIRVQVRNRRGVANIRHRQGFVAAAKPALESEWRSTLQTILASPVDLPGLYLKGSFAPEHAAHSKQPTTFRGTVNLNIAPRGLTLTSGDRLIFDCVIAARSESGDSRLVGERRLELKIEGYDFVRLLRHGINYSVAIELEEQDRSLLLIVHDAPSGRIGSISVALSGSP